MSFELIGKVICQRLRKKYKAEAKAKEKDCANNNKAEDYLFDILRSRYHELGFTQQLQDADCCDNYITIYAISKLIKKFDANLASSAGNYQIFGITRAKYERLGFAAELEACSGRGATAEHFNALMKIANNIKRIEQFFCFVDKKINEIYEEN